jgi:hypothetical protein
MDKRTRLITQIVNGEYYMFRRIPGAYPTTSQESERGFRLARANTFDSWSEATLASYAQDIAEGMRAGRNFMTEKYARMDNLIPPLSTNPLIDEIVDIESGWQKAVRAKYPRFLKKAMAKTSEEASAAQSFERYLRSELETYSDRTLASYHEDISRAQEGGENLAEQRYLKMVQSLGHDSIEAYESELSKEQGE